jgi:hypothetical protein
MAALGSTALHSYYLILRSIAKRCVSKDGQQAWCSFPPFETRPAGAPQGEAILARVTD